MTDSPLTGPSLSERIEEMKRLLEEKARTKATLEALWSTYPTARPGQPGYLDAVDAWRDASHAEASSRLRFEAAAVDLLPALLEDKEVLERSLRQAASVVNRLGAQAERPGLRERLERERVEAKRGWEQAGSSVRIAESRGRALAFEESIAMLDEEAALREDARVEGAKDA